MPNAIKLVFLADGKSVHTKKWLTESLERGYDVHLITFTAEPVEGVKIHKLRYFGKLAYPMRIWSVSRVIKKIKPDILHVHYISNYGIYAALSGFHPLVLSAWGDDIDTDPERSRVLRFFVKYALKKADLVHTGDELGRKRLIELGCDPGKIFVQDWSVDTQRFSSTARSESLRKSLGIEKSYSALCARWWSPEYHVDVFIRAMPLVLRKMSNVKFILLGGGILEGKLKELAKELGVYDNVLFIGKVSPEEMPKYLASVDVYIDTVTDCVTRASGDGPARRGGGGIGQITSQAMACETPQILSDQLNVRLTSRFRGLMYRQSDPRDLAEKIVLLLSDGELGKRIGEESRKIVLKICDLETVTKKWEAIYHVLRNSHLRKIALQ
jgi:glycosyltransferase involved in cell wall biosynthesis